MPICSLCREERTLMKSHLLPRAIYSDLKGFFSDDNDDLVIADFKGNSAFFSDFQYKQPLLCEDCEDRFNKHGEKFVLQEYNKRKDKFDLLEKLNDLPTYHSIQGDYWYDPSDYKNLSPEKYLYFASSIFWRASITKWRKLPSDYKNALGPTYTEKFRKYLLNKGIFPKNACLVVFVDNAKCLSRMAAFPSVSKESGYHQHTFIIPGIKFVLLVGKKVINPSTLYLNGEIAFVRTSFENAKNNHEFKVINNLLRNRVKPKGRLDQEKPN